MWFRLSAVIINLCLGMSYAQAVNVVNIGGVVKTLTSSTSCRIKDWKTQSNSCACCLIKTSAFVRSKTNPYNNAINVCSAKRHCDGQILRSLNPSNLIPADFIPQLTRVAIQNPIIAVNKSDIQTKGSLTPEGVRNLLTTAVHNKIITNEPHVTLLKDARCIYAQQIGETGAQVEQLFLISINMHCAIKRPAGKFSKTYILKGTKKKDKEVGNLRKIQASGLTYYDLQNPRRHEDDLAIAFDVQNFVYNTGSQSHYLSLLELAPGVSCMTLTKQFGQATVNYNPNNPTSVEAYNSLYNDVYYSFYKLGLGLSRLHQRFMKTNNKSLAIPTVIHGDLHMDNIYTDYMPDLATQDMNPLHHTKVTLIDTETFAYALDKPGPVAVDLLVVYSFSVAQLQAKYRVPKVISEVTWHNVMLKPFLLGYIQAWPQQKQAQIWRELKGIFLTGTPQVKVGTRRSMMIDPIRYKMITNKYASPIFTQIGEELGFE
ncbi:hypothetical protein [Candidatus Paracaedibacter symbiosus]|uniref:hypothetical protein n=1 Tax=Candidatus Paracaedibacter symbiosus TaxID=244582 RepID=UPI000509DCFD|nr:hypothetical protein [Candidatus Paracaedibacter symbiosus]